jgi:hypothetical protein
MKRWFIRKSVVLSGRMLTAAFLLAVAPIASAQSLCHCNDTIPAKTPLNDLGKRFYQPNPLVSKQGGLYPGGYNQRPIEHGQDGITLANQMRPIGGKIVMISIGMCNTTKEFGGALGIGVENGFQWRALHDAATRGNLVVVDCAQSGQDAQRWAENSQPWTELDTRLSEAPGGAVTRNQVQIVWLKEALIDPATFGAFPAHATALQGYLETILNHLVDPAYGFPNVKMVFLSPRTRAWTAGRDVDHTHSPEPQAYETGFADKWVIEDQLNLPGGVDQGWPWLSWGPYLWADGDIPRSDNLTWPCTYVKQDDCVHPVVSGVTKVVDQLLAFFKTDPVATPWFLKTTAPEDAPTITQAYKEEQDPVYTTTLVHFHASATPNAHTGARIKEYVWTFDDGDYAYDPDNEPLKTYVTKTFPAPSQNGNPYRVHLTVIDSLGNAASRDIVFPVATPPPGPQHSSIENAKHRTTTSPRPKQGAARKVATRSIKRVGGEVLDNIR